ncbi:hypothetical protein LJR175_007092 [Variovorax sp. LjRoot175]|uniref:hypothetical protein n=1 Tax=Variovorax sp. LjRoot175 TaxID=3342276 RepID=UPI003ECFA919
MHLLRAAHAALAPGGALIVIESLMIEFGDAFNFTVGDLFGWCRDAGLRKTEVIALAGAVSAGIAYK